MTLGDTSTDLIFVSVAAYRDPQLEPTLRDCIMKAAYPERLRFGICWQRDDEETLSVGDDPTFRVREVDWRESRGACWARAEVMKLWEGEPWYLQVDSHCRFALDWDVMLLRMMGEVESEKPVLSTYAAAFTPGEDEVLRGGPMQMVFQAFTAEGIPQLRPMDFTSQRSGRPVRARWLAAGFLFAPGSFVKEVPYDPELYFMGEESAMTVRAFTCGYDLFHPAEVVVWHDYLRAESRKHWGDHTEEQVTRPWSEMDERSRRKVQRLLRDEAVESFGLGSERTLAEYEAYAGLSLRHRKAQQYTIRGDEPPNPALPPDWPERVYPWIVKVTIERADLPEGSLEDPEMWCLGIRDREGLEVCRRDFTAERLVPLRGDGKELVLVCEFACETVPVSWTMSPLSRSRGWLRRLAGRLAEEDVALLDEAEEPA